MGLTVKTADMTAALDKFGVGYKYPIYTAICNMTGFFADKRKQHFGYAAISDNNCLLLADYNVFLSETLYEIPLSSIKNVKISKVPLIGTTTVKILFLQDGKKMRFDLTISPKIIGSDFSDHSENMQGLLEILQNCAQ